MDTRAAMQPTPRVLDTAARPASVDIVIPVLNEERALPGCVRTLAAFLDAGFPLPWRITIVDNGSTDATWPVATALAGEHEHVHARRIEVRGRGAALRAAWRESPADIVAYMDVDLSTALDALFPLVAAVASGHSEIAIGTRLGRGARIRRSARRELISRGYNALLRQGFGAGFSDAQCGFKAARARVVRPLMDKVEDDGWFFDTELLLLAEHNGLRVHEVPVDWVEDVDSRVQVVRTAYDDLKGLARVAWTIAAGRGRAPVAARPEPVPWHPEAMPVPAHSAGAVRGGTARSQGAFFLLFSVVLYALVYWLLREFQGPATANVCALVLAGAVTAVLRLRAVLFVVVNHALAAAALNLLPPGAGRPAEAGAVVAAYCLLLVIRVTASPLTRD
ncbi:glycosyltransferase [Actinomadura sp. ATCC 31491]|uniref:Glycosyltransferase n=1 Tax=Actinomadura luzonensis TaxID=2805427 RepID=A0ABT0FTI2_9ACTN|nr:glycosyltransferase [Actinomadura luzonensis]MCK2215191.1 glycosyltransferase [Actinomadura luzonensis]